MKFTLSAVLYTHVVTSLLCGVHALYTQNPMNFEMGCEVIRELVDSLCRDGSGPPIVCVHWKAVLTHERSCSTPF